MNSSHDTAAQQAASGVCGITRRRVLALSAGGLLPVWASGLARAQDFPPKLIRLQIGAPPGGSTDFTARIVAQALGAELGTSVVVENRPGNGGVTNAATVSRAVGDGSVLMMSTATATLLIPQAMPKPPLNAVTDLRAINTASVSPCAIAVNPKLNVRNIQELVALSRTRQLSLGSSGMGGLMHLIIESVAEETGANFLHVPYQGSGPGVADAMAGHIDGVVSDLAPFPPLHKEGRLRMVAVTTEKRLPEFPDVSAVSELAPGYNITNWQAIFAPASTPKAIVDKLNDALLKALARPELKERFAQGGMGIDPRPSADAFQKVIESEYNRWGKLLKAKNITVT